MKYGDIINRDEIVVIAFTNDWEESEFFILSELADTLEATVNKIDVMKNTSLADALAIKETPTFMIYHHGVLACRTIEKDIHKLVTIVNGLPKSN